ncbi:MAG TPA: hypothetical protein ENI30_02975, partial [Gammaproteobacteria bacterium]|nr:hypothetical protein [Gammaproteobacteria bacterium]
MNATCACCSNTSNCGWRAATWCEPGKTANAEVIALKQGGEAFQLLLKLTLDGGRQTLVQASSA